VYPVLKAMEEGGRLRRGYFVSGLGATQFALPGALDLLRSLRDAPEVPEVAILAATDPANPYGATLKWPALASDVPDVRATSETDTERIARGPTRAVGATVALVNGALAAYLARGDRVLLTWLPEVEPLRSHAARAIAHFLIERARSGGETPRGMLVEEIDGRPAATHPLASFLIAAGFLPGALGLQATFPRLGPSG
jgi:ATP-dependent Lhr-like helicase